MNEESEIGWKTFIVIAFFVLMAITFFTGNYGGKENEDAYRKMKKKGSRRRKALASIYDEVGPWRSLG